MSRIPSRERLAMVLREWCDALGTGDGIPRLASGRLDLPDLPWARILPDALEPWQARCYGLWERAGQILTEDLEAGESSDLADLRRHLGEALARLHATHC